MGDGGRGVGGWGLGIEGLGFGGWGEGFWLLCSGSRVYGARTTGGEVNPPRIVRVGPLFPAFRGVL